MSRGDRGEVTRPGGGGGSSPVCAPRSVLSRKSTRHPGLPAGAPIRAGFGSRDQAGRAEVLRPTCRVPWAGAQCSGVAWARRWGRELLPHQFLLYSYPRFLGSGEEDSNGVQVLCFLLKLPGKTLEAAEGRPAGRGVAGCVEGRGKHHWPSASGIETDGRGEQYYHSKDPMGAIQQIPY